MTRDAKKLRLSVTTVKSLDSDDLLRVVGAGWESLPQTGCGDCYPTHGEQTCWQPCATAGCTIDFPCIPSTSNCTLATTQC